MPASGTPPPPVLAAGATAGRALCGGCGEASVAPGFQTGSAGGAEAVVCGAACGGGLAACLRLLLDELLAMPGFSAPG